VRPRAAAAGDYQYRCSKRGLPSAVRPRFFSSAKEVRLVIDHPNYRAIEVLSAAVRRWLAEDLGEAEP
jgi:hypothetical protein